MKPQMPASALVLAAVLLCACAPNSVINPASISQMDQQSRAYPQKEYVIAAGDILDIKFVGGAEYNETGITVSPTDGYRLPWLRR
jgi:protein involved in polysaccharide export with SLBB domain